MSIDLYTEPIFNCGDVIALQLRTHDKSCTAESVISEETLKQMDGKYVVIRKSHDYIPYTSSLEPSVKDIWPVFSLYKKIFAEVPKMKELSGIRFAKMRDGSDKFCCEGNLKYFARMNYKVIGNNRRIWEQFTIDPRKHYPHMFLGINRPWYNPDESFIQHVLG